MSQWHPDPRQTHCSHSQLCPPLAPPPSSSALWRGGSAAGTKSVIAPPLPVALDSLLLPDLRFVPLDLFPKRTQSLTGVAGLCIEGGEHLWAPLGCGELALALLGPATLPGSLSSLVVEFVTIGGRVGYPGNLPDQRRKLGKALCPQTGSPRTRRGCWVAGEPHPLPDPGRASAPVAPPLTTSSAG